MLNRIVAGIFGDSVGDMLSGYRVFSRRFVKSFPAVSREFEIETELTVHSLALRVPQTTVPVGFKDRAEGSESQAAHLPRRLADPEADPQPHPPRAADALLRGRRRRCSRRSAVLLGIPVVIDFINTGLVPRLPTAVLAVGVVIVAFMSWMIGLILDGVLKSRTRDQPPELSAVPSAPLLAGG